MLIRIVFCTECDKTKYPKELIKWSGGCRSCGGKDTYKIALFDIDGDVKALLKEGK